MSSFAIFVSDHSFTLKSAGSEKKSVLYDFIGTGKKSREDRYLRSQSSYELSVCTTILSGAMRTE